MKVEIGPYRDNEAQKVKVQIDDWEPTVQTIACL